MACMTDSATLACSIRAATDALLTADEAWAAEARRGLRAALCALENALAATQSSPCPLPPKPADEVRIWMDGAFDMMHFGHINAFRQGRALGTFLVVGVNSDESISRCKGPPIMNDAERCSMVRACKFVDEVVEDVPYVMDAAYIARLLSEFRIDYIVHGDDLCIVDGRDVYEAAKKRGAYRSIPRTEGVSTTDLVGRMLLMSNRTTEVAASDAEDTSPRTRIRALSLGDDDLNDEALSDSIGESALRRSRAFLSTSRMHRDFARGTVAPARGATVVYVAGAWDLFHAGHVAFLKAARALGDYLIVGIYADALVAQRRGGKMPIMNMQERVLSVLGCRHVDDALIDAPWVVSTEMIESFGICVVARGDATVPLPDPFAEPKARGIFKAISSNSPLSTLVIAHRVRAHHDRLLSRYVSKLEKEDEYYATRHQAPVHAHRD